MCHGQAIQSGPLLGVFRCAVCALMSGRCHSVRLRIRGEVAVRIVCDQCLPDIRATLDSTCRPTTD